jgi:predicted Rossmann fold flavoprotein
MKELSGISLPVALSMWKKTLQGDLLYAHKGISGPVVLNGSLYWEKGAIEADFLPHTTVEECVQKGGNKFVSGIFPLPRRFIEGFMNSFDLPDAPYKNYTDDQKELLGTLKKYRFAPAGNFGYSKAEVTKGGICADEIDPLTMESKVSKGLYLLGEMVDVTGEVGGYNFQWAFSSAVIAAKELSKR